MFNDLPVDKSCSVGIYKDAGKIISSLHCFKNYMTPSIMLYLYKYKIRQKCSILTVERQQLFSPWSIAWEFSHFKEENPSPFCFIWGKVNTFLTTEASIHMENGTTRSQPNVEKNYFDSPC